MQQSLFYVSYKATTNKLVICADDTQPRRVTTATMVDYDTLVAGDRFGNIFVNRLERIDADMTGAQHKETPSKTHLVAHFHVGDLVTSITKVPAALGGRDVLMYTGLHGTIGVLIPLTLKADLDLLSTLEQWLRKVPEISLVGRDHLAWRGYYVPMKGVFDGDLCEMFGRLTTDDKTAITSGMGFSQEEILKKVEQMREFYAF